MSSPTFWIKKPHYSSVFIPGWSVEWVRFNIFQTFLWLLWSPACEVHIRTTIFSLSSQKIFSSLSINWPQLYTYKAQSSRYLHIWELHVSVCSNKAHEFVDSELISHRRCLYWSQILQLLANLMLLVTILKRVQEQKKPKEQVVWIHLDL
jgi:hypothetical protein